MQLLHFGFAEEICQSFFIVIQMCLKTGGLPDEVNAKFREPLAGLALQCRCISLHSSGIKIKIQSIGLFSTEQITCRPKHYHILRYKRGAGFLLQDVSFTFADVFDQYRYV